MIQSVNEEAELFKKHQRFVVSRVSKLIGSFDKHDDLVQAGNIGLIHAIRKFDKTRGFKFSTYAVFYIDKFIYDAKRRNSLIYVPALQWQKISHLKNTIPPKEDLNLFHASNALKKVFRINIDPEAGDIFNLTVDQNLPERFDESEIHKAISHLTPRQKKIIEMKFGFNGYGKANTCNGIKKHFGICTSRVNKIIHESCQRLRIILRQIELGLIK